MKNKCDDYHSEIVHCLWLGRDLFQKIAANYVLACWSAFEVIVAKIDTHRIVIPSHLFGTAKQEWQPRWYCRLANADAMATQLNGDVNSVLVCIRLISCMTHKNILILSN